jgi:hypothetical protein
VGGGTAGGRRQLVEVEYLLWAFSDNEEVAREWLQADRDTLRKFFAPATIRQRSNGKFRASEYQFHCNFGGHPSPDSTRVLVHHGHCLPADVIWADLANHLQRVWDRSMAVWQKLHDARALVPDPPSLRDALIGEKTVFFTHDHAPTPGSSGLASCLIEPETGRIEVTVVSPSE